MRQRIFDTAAEMFLDRGYTGTTLRGIAGAVGVDVSTVAHHGGRKHQLFAASLAATIGPASILDALLRLPPDRIPGALVELVTRVWSDEDTRRPLELVLARALTDEDVRAACRDYLDREVLRPLADHIGGQDATERALAVMAMVSGTLITRHVLGLAPSLDTAEPLRHLLPDLRRVILRRVPHRRSD